jgi:hypothetical protein
MHYLFAVIIAYVMLLSPAVAQDVPESSPPDTHEDCPCHDEDNLPRCVMPPKPTGEEKPELLVWNSRLLQCVYERRCVLV